MGDPHAVVKLSEIFRDRYAEQFEKRSKFPHQDISDMTHL